MTAQAMKEMNTNQAKKKEAKRKNMKKENENKKDAPNCALPRAQQASSSV